MTSLDTLAEPVHIGGKLPEVAYDTIALADMNPDGKTDINGDGRPDLLGLRQDGTLVAHAHSGAFDPENPTAVLREPVVVAKGRHGEGPARRDRHQLTPPSADPAISSGETTPPGVVSPSVSPYASLLRPCGPHSICFDRSPCGR
ncbi:hypothetical protein AB0B95_08665 [Streptomyces hygroscopicus]|uniref:hypothetical protein n=1 Tax=Streptomyces hygroscopicus TaxID=1912 RepID=UPI000ADF5467